MLDALRKKLYTPVDIASVVVFRVGFGFIMLYEVWRYMSHDWVRMFYIRPEFMFKYYGFEWLQAWPGNGMTWHFVALGVLAFMIMVGAAYRIATVLFLIGFSYVFLLDQARYLNHFYFVILLSLLMCFVPAHRAFSVDAWLRPKLRSATIPGWALFALLIQMEIVLLYAGIVKITPDWLQGQPLGMWLANDADLFLVGQLFEQKWAIVGGSWAVIILHCVGAPLLFFKSTRMYVFVLYCSFHFLNHLVFEIGIFPWLTIVGTTLFFDPDWPRKLGRRVELHVARLMERRHDLGQGTISSQLVAGPAAPPAMQQPSPLTVALISILGVWMVLQAVIPLRHYLYPGDVAWTEEGHRFAWRMKLRNKSGRIKFVATDPATGNEWSIDPRNYLTSKQTRVMACRPDMMLQFAHYLAQRLEAEANIHDAVIQAKNTCSLNGRPRLPIVDPERNLAQVERSLAAADWLLPNDKPLPQFWRDETRAASR
ncbi:MAG: HTTM domain-containing protein [Gammaproteobacteria bacterium]|nr:HTTM domain-containing protein [Gammaproteobacteria bacterium]NNF61764.1 HTTM domain-containing protein [Gammaproteobacteria bacterium]NNM20429.1 HTTM domain-containing protein [Gammaproteobacteria bacterium]